MTNDKSNSTGNARIKPGQGYTADQLLRFIIPSVIGAAVFLLPIPYDDTVTIIIGLLHDALQNLLEVQLPYIGMVLVLISAILTLVTVFFKPASIMNTEFLKEVFDVGPVWYVSRTIGAIMYVMVIYELGPEFIWSIDTGGTPGYILIPILVSLFVFTSFVISLLTEFGLMEYIGTLLRNIMKPLFTIPGRAAIDSLASWLGSPSVAIIVSRKMYDEGYYTGREAGVITTTFSLVGIGYIYVMASVVGLPELYFQLLFSTYIVSVILAFIMPRIWPLSRIPDTYNEKVGKQIVEEKEGDVTLHQWAVNTAVNRAQGSDLNTFFRTGIKTLLIIYMSTLPLVMAWGGIALIVAVYTPIFDWLATPFAFLLQLINIPEAAELAPAFLLALPDQFLAGVIGAGLESRIASFMAAGISITGLVYLSEVGVLILDSKIPINILHLVVIYLIRAVLTVFLLAPFAFWFC